MRTKRKRSASFGGQPQALVARIAEEMQQAAMEVDQALTAGPSFQHQTLSQALPGEPIVAASNVNLPQNSPQTQLSQQQRRSCGDSPVESPSLDNSLQQPNSSVNSNKVCIYETHVLSVFIYYYFFFFFNF
jgi:hypothetical protein